MESQALRLRERHLPDSPQIEFARSITRELVEQHKTTWRQENKRLVSAILFGPLAAGEYEEDINLLEIVEGYPYPRPQGGVSVHEFESTRQFPMYGRLRLHCMSPQEFSEAVSGNTALIAEVREQHEILHDDRHFAEKLLR